MRPVVLADNAAARELLTDAMGAIQTRIATAAAKTFSADKLELGLGMTYMRCDALFSAVRVLISNGLANEAVLLGRPLYEDSLELHHLSQLDPPSRLSEIAYDIKSDFMQNRALFAQAHPGIRTAEGDLAGLIKREAEFDAYLAVRQIAPRRLMEPTALVTKYGEPNDAWAWKLSQHMVHGNNHAHTGRFFHTGDNNYEYRLESSPPEALGLPAMWACRSYARAHAAMVEMVPDFSPVDEPEHEATQALRQLDLLV